MHSLGSYTPYVGHEWFYVDKNHKAFIPPKHFNNF